MNKDQAIIEAQRKADETNEPYCVVFERGEYFPYKASFSHTRKILTLRPFSSNGSKVYWTKEDLELWNEYKNKSLEELINRIDKAFEGLSGDAELVTIVEALRMKVGLKFKMPNAYSKKYMIEFGCSESELIEAKP